MDSKHSELKEFYKLYFIEFKFKRILQISKVTNPSLKKQKIVKIYFWIMSMNFTINTLILTNKKKWR